MQHSAPVFKLLEAEFEVFHPAAPQGRHVALMGVNFGTEEGTEGVGIHKRF